MFPKLPGIYQPCSHLQQTGHCRFNLYSSVSRVGQLLLHFKSQNGGTEEIQASFTQARSASLPAHFLTCTSLPLLFTYSLSPNTVKFRFTTCCQESLRGTAGRTLTGKLAFRVQNPFLPTTHQPNQFPSLSLSLFICKLDFIITSLWMVVFQYFGSSLE